MLFRIEPLMRPEHYRTFQVTAPVRTHFRAATSCEDAECVNYYNGWKTVIDESTELGKSQARYIRKESGRGFKEQKAATGLTEFIFESGQNCFGLKDHKVRLDKPQKYFVRSGDYRNLGHPSELRADQWQEEFEENQDRVSTIIERG